MHPGVAGVRLFLCVPSSPISIIDLSGRDLYLPRVGKFPNVLPDPEYPAGPRDGWASFKERS